MARCYFCSGPIEERPVRVFRQRGGHIQVIDDVPAEVCTRCGLESYPGWVALEMERILADDVPEETISVPAFRFKKSPESTEIPERELAARR